jgi:hypothetical protein
LFSLVTWFLFWIHYFWSRKRLNYKVRYRRVAFLVNLILIIMLLGPGQLWLLGKLNLINQVFVVFIFVQLMGACIHHLITLINSYPGAVWIPRIHGPISHLMFFVPLGINFFVICQTLISQSSSYSELFGSMLLAVLLVGGSLVGVLVGVNVIKLPYK